ncbi:hypothetical protein Pmar_PMAR022372 [Perkinsus marinus ATCC 50983]|uniref:Uncharacterized protein n=1 Tax=Perkinsus marinus (strain ATCC 50983 / TXsc) TaxID=423536 RepID=C5KDW6_PERM5|nr:hypothetical protein Pmar_PMAR022372 [Perkinsus marinus ATCC 50983]EER17419.1 hypothetical protein Pmar_PMAR022372 [Perkinsus marinus ATCC 50983]|eukprot:XP_002785623.1 hypothetical protein Pmar_PMAR022372 [Perkinsus marinus ATCC 50983]
MIEQHEFLLEAGYTYDKKTNRYFMSGEPSWELENQKMRGRWQGAFPASTIDEFKQEEDRWVKEQMQKASERKNRQSKVEETA